MAFLCYVYHDHYNHLSYTMTTWAPSFLFVRSCFVNKVLKEAKFVRSNWWHFFFQKKNHFLLLPPFHPKTFCPVPGLSKIRFPDFVYKYLKSRGFQAKGNLTQLKSSICQTTRGSIQNFTYGVLPLALWISTNPHWINSWWYICFWFVYVSQNWGNIVIKG